MYRRQRPETSTMHHSANQHVYTKIILEEKGCATWVCTEHKKNRHTHIGGLYSVQALPTLNLLSNTHTLPCKSLHMKGSNEYNAIIIESEKAELNKRIDIHPVGYPLI